MCGVVVVVAGGRTIVIELTPHTKHTHTHTFWPLAGGHVPPRPASCPTPPSPAPPWPVLLYDLQPATWYNISAVRHLANYTSQPSSTYAIRIG